MKPREFAKNLVNLGMEYQELEVRLNYAKERYREKSAENKNNKKLIGKLIEILEKNNDEKSVELQLRDEYLENKLMEEEEYNKLMTTLQKWESNR